MKSQELILKWSKQLAAKTGRTESEIKEDGLFFNDFTFPGIRINFEDRSYVVFKYAFALKDEEYPNVIAVFTEHNGYYEFPFGEDDDLIINK
jgi:hypothetical protein